MKKKIGWLLYVFVGGILPHGSVKQFPISQKIRRIACSLLFDRIGSNVNIGRKIRFSKNVSLGSDSSIGNNSYISGVLEIGENVMIAPNCKFIGINHIFSKTKPFNDIGKIKNPIKIEDNTWIGYGSIILGGVTIGEGSVVGAGSVVTKDVPPWTVVGGNPAKVIKGRG